MIPVLYLHGFASSPHSQKVDLLRELLRPDGIELNAPDLNLPSFEKLDFGAMARHALAAAAGNAPRVIAGSSLGGLLALEVIRRGLHLPAVLIAPALGVSQHWIGRIGPGDPVKVFNHARNADAWIHRAFFEQVAGLEVDHAPPPERVTVIMGRMDESIPFEQVESTWKRWVASGRLAPGSRFIEIPDGDHSLVAHVRTIAEAIRRTALGVHDAQHAL